MTRPTGEINNNNNSLNNNNNTNMGNNSGMSKDYHNKQDKYNNPNNSRRSFNKQQQMMQRTSSGGSNSNLSNIGGNMHGRGDYKGQGGRYQMQAQGGMSSQGPHGKSTMGQNMNYNTNNRRKYIEIILLVYLNLVISPQINYVGFWARIRDR